MESPINVARWTPSSTRAIEDIDEDDHLELQHIAASSEQQAADDKSTFPFSTVIPSISFIQSQKSTGEMEEALGQQNGAILTWKDLCVRVSKGKNESHAILQGLTGYAEPGKVLAIMGPSGCGKSSLLDALAGIFSLFSIRNYNFLLAP